MWLLTAVSSCNMKVPSFNYMGQKNQANYPSGSTVSYLDDHFYIMGDDASELLILNGELKETGRIPLFPQGEDKRIDKAVKADIESSAVINRNGKKLLLLLGSGSVSPHRDSAFLVDPQTKHIQRLDLESFYDQLRKDFKQLNIEGAALVGDELVLGIRANRTYPDNYLVVASSDVFSLRFKRKILIKLPVGGAGISGLDFDHRRDILFITFSTEDTPNAYEDGVAGDSYLAVIPDITRQLGQKELEIHSVTKLTDLNSDFFRQKIESVALTDEKDQLLLVADDDKGNTTLFRLGL